MSTLHVIGGSGLRYVRPVADVGEVEESIERTLFLLTDIDRRYEQERSIIEGAKHPQAWKDWRLEQLARRHAGERQPLVELLALLHRQLVAHEAVA